MFDFKKRDNYSFKPMATNGAEPKKDNILLVIGSMLMIAYVLTSATNLFINSL